MAEALTKLWGNFSLSEAELAGVDFLDEDGEGIVEKGKTCLVGKLMSDRIVGKDAVKVKMIRNWKPSEGLSFKVMGDNLFLIEFVSHWDKERVLEGRPWTCEGQLFSVEDFDGHLSPDEINFDFVSLWVRMYKLPLACMGKEMGQKLGAVIGNVEEVDTNEHGIGWGAFLRVKVQVNVHKPLPRGTMLRMKQRSIWIPFQYEKVPRICFSCGVIYHGVKGCSGRDGGRRMGIREEYGPWLRVQNPKPWLEKRKQWESEGIRPHFNGTDSGSEQSRTEEIIRPEMMEGQKRKDPVGDNYVNAFNKEDYGWQKSGAFPRGEDVAVSEETVEGKRQRYREKEDLWDSNKGAKNKESDLRESNKGAKNMESDLRDSNKGAKNKEFIARNGKEQDLEGVINENQSAGIKVGVEILGAKVNEVFNEFLKEKAGGFQSGNTGPISSGVGQGGKKGKETTMDNSKQGRVYKSPGSPNVRTWKKLARDRYGIGSEAQQTFQAQGKRPAALQEEDTDGEIGHKRGKGNGTSKYTLRNNEAVAGQQPRQSQ
jgi:hypothetical protein